MFKKKQCTKFLMPWFKQSNIEIIACFYNMSGDNDSILHDFDANTSDNFWHLKKERRGIVDEKK